MTTFLDDDERFERELFARRATALAAPTLDVEDVFARAESRAAAAIERRRAIGARLARAVAWGSAAACAAATYVGVLRAPGPSSALGPAEAAEASTSTERTTGEAAVVLDEGDALACDGRLFSSHGSSLGGACTASTTVAFGSRPRSVDSALCADDDVTFSRATP